MTSETRAYYTQGVLPTALAAIIWGFTAATRRFLPESVGALSVTLIWVMSGLIFTLFAFRLKPSFVLNVPRRYWLRIVASGFFNIVIGTTAWVAAVNVAPLSLLSILARLQPFLTMILAHYLLGERLGRKQYALAVLAVLLVVAIVTNQSPQATPYSLMNIAEGCGYVLLAIIFYSLASIAGKSLSADGLSSLHLTVLHTLVGTLFLIPIVLLFDRESLFNYSTTNYAVVILSGIIGGGFAFITYYHGLKIVAVSISSLIMLLSPFVTIVFAHFAFDETLTAYQIVAALGLAACLVALTHIEAHQTSQTAKLTRTA